MTNFSALSLPCWLTDLLGKRLAVHCDKMRLVHQAGGHFNASMWPARVSLLMDESVRPLGMETGARVSKHPPECVGLNACAIACVYVNEFRPAFRVRRVDPAYAAFRQLAQLLASLSVSASELLGVPLPTTCPYKQMVFLIREVAQRLPPDPMRGLTSLTLKSSTVVPNKRPSVAVTSHGRCFLTEAVRGSVVFQGRGI